MASDSFPYSAKPTERESPMNSVFGKETGRMVEPVVVEGFLVVDDGVTLVVDVVVVVVVVVVIVVVTVVVVAVVVVVVVVAVVVLSEDVALLSWHAGTTMRHERISKNVNE